MPIKQLGTLEGMPSHIKRKFHYLHTSSCKKVLMDYKQFSDSPMQTSLPILLIKSFLNLSTNKFSVGRNEKLLETLEPASSQRQFLKKKSIEI